MCNCHLTCIGTVGQQGHLGCKNTNLAKTKVFFGGGAIWITSKLWWSRNNLLIITKQVCVCNFWLFNALSTAARLLWVFLYLIEMWICFTAAMANAAADFDDIAAALEDAIFKEFKSTETKYKNRIRSRIANLKVKQASL